MNYSIWLTDNDLRPTELLDDVYSFEYVKVLNGVGVAKVVLGLNGRSSDPKSYWNRGLMIYRNGSLDFFGLCSAAKVQGSADRNLILVFQDIHKVLANRIVAYPSETAQTKITGTIDDIMRQVVRDNIEKDASADRNLSNFINFDVELDTSTGPVITVEDISYQNVLTVLRDLWKISLIEGDEFLFRILPTIDSSAEGRISFRFVVLRATEVVGGSFTEFSSTDEMDVIDRIKVPKFSEELGSFLSTEMIEDYFDAANVAYIPGPGTGSNRKLIERKAPNSTTKGMPRTETVSEAPDSQSIVDSTYETYGDRELGLKAGSRKFKGIINPDSLPLYQTHWNIGSFASATIQGMSFYSNIRGVKIAVDPSGKETIEASIVMETAS